LSVFFCRHYLIRGLVGKDLSPQTTVGNDSLHSILSQDLYKSLAKPNTCWFSTLLQLNGRQDAFSRWFLSAVDANYRRVLQRSRQDGSRRGRCS